MFHATGNTVTFPLAKSKKVSYFSFLSTLKDSEWCKRIRLATELFTLHSLRRGHVLDAVDTGIPECIIQASGWWKSHICFKGYIDDEVAL
eukprot:1010492-Rhodomonas_salina.1